MRTSWPAWRSPRISSVCDEIAISITHDNSKTLDLVCDNSELSELRLLSLSGKSRNCRRPLQSNVQRQTVGFQLINFFFQVKRTKYKKANGLRAHSHDHALTV